MPNSTSQLLSPASSAIPHEQISIPRLEPVYSDDVLQQTMEESEIKFPHWLRPLNLQQSRRGIRCLLPRTLAAKRALDIIVASSLLVFTLPILLVAAIAIRVTSRGPILFTQTRVGLNARRQWNSVREPNSVQICRRNQANYGRPFKIYKLRTMYTGADIQGPTLAHVRDRRVTTVGRLLRRMRIDELPQLVNVLQGQMSMVGPRPECIEYMEELSAKIPDYIQRLGLKPGLTGIAQIEAGYANDLESYRRKVAYDLMYLQNCCLQNDLKILWRTVRVVLTGFGAL